MEIKRVVVWFSAGVSSAIAAKLTLDKYKDIYPIELVNTDTGSEHPDNFRFIKDCESWLGLPVKLLKNKNFEDTFDVYRKTRYLVGPYGARCSLELKKKVRQEFENIATDLQVFGYNADIKEKKRAERFRKNNPLVNVYFPLIETGLTKRHCHRLLKLEGIIRPRTYEEGFKNANCLLRGCVKGGAGYWNFIRKKLPHVFWNMAQMERELGISILTKTTPQGELIRLFLDELAEDVGNYENEPPISCGPYCEALRLF